MSKRTVYIISGIGLLIVMLFIGSLLLKAKCVKQIEYAEFSNVSYYTFIKFKNRNDAIRSLKQGGTELSDIQLGDVYDATVKEGYDSDVLDNSLLKGELTTNKKFNTYKEARSYCVIDTLGF